MSYQILTIVGLFTFHARQTHDEKCSVFLKVSSDISLKKTISVNQMNHLSTSFNKLFFNLPWGKKNLENVILRNKWEVHFLYK